MLPTKGGKALDLGDNVGQAVKPGELWAETDLAET
jgi:hypothetical protein